MRVLISTVKDIICFSKMGVLWRAVIPLCHRFRRTKTRLAIFNFKAGVPQMPKEPEGRGRLGTPFPSRGFLSPRCLAQLTHLPCRAEGSSRASLCPRSHNSVLSRGCFLTWPPCRASTWLSEMRSGRVFPRGFIFSLVYLD